MNLPTGVLTELSTLIETAHDMLAEALPDDAYVSVSAAWNTGDEVGVTTLTMSSTTADPDDEDEDETGA